MAEPTITTSGGGQSQFKVVVQNPPQKSYRVDGLTDARASWELWLSKGDPCMKDALEGWYTLMWVPAFLEGAAHFAEKLHMTKQEDTDELSNESNK